MSGISLLLTINLVSIYFIGQQSFIGLIICVWIVYFLGFAHLATNHVTGIETKLNPARVRNKTRNIESDS